MSPADLVSEALGSTQVTLQQLARDGAPNDRARWLQGQLRSIEQQLTHMLVDLESGRSIQDLGAMNDQDFEELLEIFGAEIRMLKALIQVCLEMGR